MAEAKTEAKAAAAGESVLTLQMLVEGKSKLIIVDRLKQACHSVAHAQRDPRPHNSARDRDVAFAQSQVLVALPGVR